MNHSQKIIKKCDGIITNCDSLVITKWDGQLLQMATAFLLHEVRHGLLQITTGITKCDEFITNYDRYYKVRWLLQIATVQIPPA